MYFISIIVLACSSTCQCFIKNDGYQEHCDQLKQWLQFSTVSIQLNRMGFHRQVTATVQHTPDVLRGVSMVLLYTWPPGVYLDPYELASLRDQHWQILIDPSIDVEVPAQQTSGFLTYVFPTNTGPSVLHKVTLPVHGRYHEPSSVGETFTSVHIEAPELLLRTDKCTHLNRLESFTVVDAPCTVSNSSLCLWVKTHHQQEPSTISFQVPVGDGSVGLLVCGLTLLVTVICCVTLSKYMMKHRIN